MNSNWRSLVYMMVGLTTLQVASAGAEKLPMGFDSRPAIRHLVLEGQLVRDGEGPPRRLHVVMSNAGADRVCIAVGQGGWGVIGLQPAFVGSFGRLEDTLEARAEGRTAYQLKVLAPGQREVLEFDLAGRYPGWSDDHYTLVLRYAPGQALLRSLSAEAAQHQCRLVAGPILAEPLPFKVAGVPGSAGRQDYARLWRSDAPAGERWKALMWLGRNALAVGMHRNEVLALLGTPGEVRDSTQWIFSLGSEGFKVTFAGERIAKVEIFIS